MNLVAGYEKVSKISGSSVSLRVDYKLHVPGRVTWTKNNSYINDDRHILAQDNSLIITDLRKTDEGVYQAVDDQKRTVAKYLLSIETSKNCKLNFLILTLWMLSWICGSLAHSADSLMKCCCMALSGLMWFF